MFRSCLSAAILSVLFCHGSRAQPAPSATPKYVPPACQGKPITVVPREVALAQSPTEIKTNPPIAKEDQLKLFDVLVEIISDVYVYPDFHGLNWPAAVKENRAQIGRGLETEAFYRAMEKFVLALGDQHSHFDSPAKVAADKASLAGQNNYVGIGALFQPLLEKKRVAILAVMPDSSAEHGGLKQHDALLTVDGLPMVADGKVYQQRTRGPECSVAVLTIQSPGQSPRDITLVRYRISAPVPIYARLVKTADGSRIGYVFLPSFFDVTLVEQVKQALTGFGSLDGLIIDNRMNTGGSSKVLLPILSYFTTGTVGHLVGRTTRRPMEITANPIGNSQKVPLVILVSKETVSYGEIFSGILQDMGRAKLAGQRTAGRVETLRGHIFIEGSIAWIAEERFDPVNSHADWKSGLKPDAEVVADWDTFTLDNDPGVAVAMKLLGHR
jgi:carboxyl-terminal processing protease